MLRVDDDGVRLVRRTPQRHRRDVAVIPWTSIHELVLTEDDPPQFDGAAGAAARRSRRACAA